MSSAKHRAAISWERGGAVFTDNKFSRGHRWRFDGGVEVPASAAPEVVQPPLSVVAAVDPEEALVAAMASCHMLWFLSIAAKRGFVVERYRDDAVGTMGTNAQGKPAIAEVALRPQVTFGGGARPSAEEHEAMHHQAHERCFIANSVTAMVTCTPVDASAPAPPPPRVGARG
jgi:organic hydroperoxide reductase OsmC/OhrA